MIITIKEVTQEFTRSGAEYKKVLGLTGDGKPTTKSVFDNLKDKWKLLKENTTLDFTMEKKGQFWNVTDIKLVELPKVVKEAVKEGAKLEKIESKYKADPDKTASIELQVCLKAATDLSVALINAGILKEKTTERVIITTKEFAKLFS